MPSLAAATRSRERIEFATRPFLPITRPASSGATCSSKMTVLPLRLSFTDTPDGSSTSERTTYSSKSRIEPPDPLRSRRGLRLVLLLALHAASLPGLGADSACRLVGLLGLGQQDIDRFALAQPLKAVHRAALGEELQHAVRRLRADFQPVQRAALVDDDRLRACARVVQADAFNEAAVARRVGVGHDDPVSGGFLRAHAAQSDSNHVGCSFADRL